MMFEELMNGRLKVVVEDSVYRNSRDMKRKVEGRYTRYLDDEEW